MTDRQKLSPEEIQARVAGGKWQYRDGKLHREYRFADFAHAMGFFVTAALGIEKMDHHPEWSNVYNRVSVDLTTHDAGGVTAMDFRLADILDRAAGDAA